MKQPKSFALLIEWLAAIVAESGEKLAVWTSLKGSEMVWKSRATRKGLIYAK